MGGRRLVREMAGALGFIACVIICVTLGSRLRTVEIVVIAVFFSVNVAAAILILVGERRNRRRLLHLRPRLNDREIIARYYAGSELPAPRVTEAWHTVATVLCVEPGRLRPEDRLDTLFGLPAWLAPWDWGDGGRLLQLTGCTVADRPATIDEVVMRLVNQPETEEAE